MRVPFHVIGLLLATGLATGRAAHAEPLTPADSPALNAPEPPGRYVLPATTQPTLPPPADEPPVSTAAPGTAKPPVRNPNPRPATTQPPPDPLPTDPPVPPAAPAVLLTSANSPQFEQRVRDQLRTAQAHLDQLSRGSLGSDAQAQFDAAKGFIRQALEALKVKNLVYAGQLADKAATMAALLKK